MFAPVAPGDVGFATVPIPEPVPDAPTAALPDVPAPIGDETLAVLPASALELAAVASESASSPSHALATVMASEHHARI
jgi:hypothetical protein